MLMQRETCAGAQVTHGYEDCKKAIHGKGKIPGMRRRSCYRILVAGYKIAVQKLCLFCNLFHNAMTVSKGAERITMFA
jgi:hypothetical protein